MVLSTELDSIHSNTKKFLVDLSKTVAFLKSHNLEKNLGFCRRECSGRALREGKTLLPNLQEGVA